MGEIYIMGSKLDVHVHKAFVWSWMACKKANHRPLLLLLTKSRHLSHCSPSSSWLLSCAFQVTWERWHPCVTVQYLSQVAHRRLAVPYPIATFAGHPHAWMHGCIWETYSSDVLWCHQATVSCVVRFLAEAAEVGKCIRHGTLPS